MQKLAVAICVLALVLAGCSGMTTDDRKKPDSLSENIGDLGRDMAEDGGKIAEDVGDAVGDAAKDVGDTVGDAAAGIEENVREYREANAE